MTAAMADRLERYREKRDPGATPEPPGDDVPASGAVGCAAFRRPGAPRPRAALGPAARARRRARLLGGAARHPAGARAQPPRGAHRGPPARVPRVPRRDPGRPVRRRDDEDLGPRHLRGAQVPRRRGHGHVPRRARARPLRAVPHPRRRLDDPPHGPAGRPGPRADARAARRRCSPAPGRCRARTAAGPTRSSGTACGRSRSCRAGGSGCRPAAGATSPPATRSCGRWPRRSRATRRCSTARSSRSTARARASRSSRAACTSPPTTRSGGWRARTRCTTSPSTCSTSTAAR